ncbi:hypothetical protein [uncultured Paracoccus sp.]|uniref:hypothetical protein n=1 Tax=uncultured Paracoccus sp. TaxID=189685 RepID=UPI00260CCAC6|nr:hypothetical protein [uncultured Paracoccus sp.]
MTFLRLSLILPVMAIAACDQLGSSPTTPAPRPVVSQVTTSEGTTIVAAPTADGDAVLIATPPQSGSLPQPAARTVAQLDTTTAAEKAQAASAGGSGQKLGTTIASLGDAAQSGFWIKTPLVRAPGKGRIVNPATGKSANVDLIPLDGPPTAGSQVSLPALQMIGASLTDLPEIEVWGA